MAVRTLLKNAFCLDFARNAFLPKDLLIEDERMVQVGLPMEGSSCDVSIDLGGYYVLPGLIDLHVHLSWDGSVDPTESLARETREMTLLRMVHHARQTVLSGITTVRDLGAVDDLSLALSSAIEKGFIIGPRVVAAGKSLIMTGGHDPFWGVPVDGPWEAIKAVRTQVDKGAKVIKVSATGGVYGRREGEEVGQSELTRDELEAICKEAHRLGLRVASHALGREGVENSVLAGCDTIEHGIFATDAILNRMAEQGTFLTPTLFTYRNIAEGNAPDYAKKKAQEVVEQLRRCFVAARQKGVKISAGSDAGSPELPHPSLLLEMKEMVSLGISPLEAIRTATLGNAEALGMEGLIGSIEEGKLADLLILQEDPTEELGRLKDVWGVVKHGMFIKHGERRV
jgi:imidazolonepropionase-like amidohydrolase